MNDTPKEDIKNKERAGVKILLELSETVMVSIAVTSIAILFIIVFVKGCALK